jgi:NitT/TauT family transport system ATP-binding protein
LKPKPIAGVRDPLERSGEGATISVRIDRKAYRPGSGAPIEALRDLAFDLPPGTFTALIGPSGCGKTTTLRILAGLDRDFEGAISPSLATRRIGYVFQEPRLLPWRTVEQNIRLALPPERQDVDLDPLLSELGIAEFRSRFPGELSLGMARRAGLARAFAVAPDVLLLDEPFVSLDAATAERLRHLLVALWRKDPMTVLLVTHNIREAVSLAERVVLLSPRPGQVVGTEILPALRDPAAVERIVADLAARYPGAIHAAG